MHRRTFLKASTVAAVSTSAAIAGCLGGEGPAAGDGLPGEDYPEIDEWLTETDEGDADGTYDGTVVDRRDQNRVRIEVGAAGNGANFAYSPSAVVISPGTTVRWVWTGEGGTHNVDAEPDEQLGVSDYEYSSGEPTDEAGYEYTKTFDEAGVSLYHCEPHLSVGMKGGIAIEE